jgi:hypothetical protein
MPCIYETFWALLKVFDAGNNHNGATTTFTCRIVCNFTVYCCGLGMATVKNIHLGHTTIYTLHTHINEYYEY